jgi:DnaJ-class molecular chaperone
MAKQNVKCGKCDGSGKLSWAGHIDNGKCYACMGSGTVSANKISERNAAKIRANIDLGSLCEAGERILDVNQKWALHMCRRAAGEMLIAADTEWSRRQLATVPNRLRAAIIEAGRELKAAQPA